MNIFSKILKKRKNRKINPLFDLGFHGDKYLLRLVDSIMHLSEAFIETGADVGTTTRYMADRYSKKEIYSCEPDKTIYKEAKKNLYNFENANIFNSVSPKFLYMLHKSVPQLRKSVNFYFLDAHEFGYKWPLRKELQFITKHQEKAFILVDDTKVPDNDAFFYSAYEGIDCDLNYITKSLSSNKEYTIAYPLYSEHTSTYHPLVGTILIIFGDGLAEEISRDAVEFIFKKLIL